ncbi:MAG: hypothetical protein ACFNVK_12905, partial [Prevotella sp.]
MKPQQTLNIIFYTCIGLSLLTALLFETNTLIGGWWADNRSADFLCTAILELLSLCAIPAFSIYSSVFVTYILLNIFR